MSVAGFFFLFAFLPKLIAAVLAIPSPVVGAYLVVLVAVLFVTGLRILTQDGLDYRTGVIVGFSFWVGVAVHLAGSSQMSCRRGPGASCSATG